MNFPASVLELVQKQLALTGRVGSTRTYVVNSVSTVPAASAPNQPAISEPGNVRFTSDGYVLAMYGQESAQATPQSYARTGVRLQIDGSEDLFLDGNGGPTYSRMLGLFGGVNNWYPMIRRVRSGDLWNVIFANYDTGNVCQPEVEFAFFSDVDVAHMVAAAAQVR